jgi:RimJ/RimL family protein N-acetyltransferase
MPPIITRALCTLRPFRPGDEEALRQLADDPDVARNLADRFPSPYTRKDAEEWVATCQNLAEGQTVFAIEVDGALAGGAGFEGIGAVYPRTAMVGYWLGRAFWGRGIATEALRALTAHAFASIYLNRLEAGVFPWNRASMRVLEKAGYRFETVLKGRLFKDGAAYDEHLYARLRDDR